jgi:phosphoserine phosphatase RsbU/P
MVGGDIYDCIELRPNMLGLTIGDVSGKGMPAALYMARLLSDFRFYAQQAEDPVPTIQILNEMLAERSQQGMFVTLIYMTLDTSRGILSYVNGGHIPPILFRRTSGELIKLDQAAGIPLGIRSAAEFSQEDVTLQHGDTLILISDGVTDAKNGRGERFSIKRLEKVLRGAWNTAEELVTGIVEAVLKHCGDEKQFDDITILVLKWR